MSARMIKLHRSYNHRILAGVMGGIAEYLGWNPFMLRLLFVIVSSISVAVPGLIIYVVLWLLMPNADMDSYQR
mgnify:CR=1 FL=1